jgi:DNA-binding NarL/FixJ family response regulator
MKGSTKIVVTCGNRLLREAIARILTKKDEFEILAAQVASSSFSFNDEIVALGADLLVHDSLEIFGGDPRSGKTCVVGRTLSYVLVAMDDNHEQFLAAIQRGVLGYVLRDASAADVLSAVRAVAQGQAACPPAYTRVLFDYIAGGADKAANVPAPVVYGLTRREQQLVPLLSRGLTNKEIASHLHLSEQTVKNHIHRMMKKMQASNRVEVCDAWRKQCAATGTKMDWYFGASDASAALESTEY